MGNITYSHTLLCIVPIVGPECCSARSDKRSRQDAIRLWRPTGRAHLQMLSPDLVTVKAKVNQCGGLGPVIKRHKWTSYKSNQNWYIKLHVIFSGTKGNHHGFLVKDETSVLLSCAATEGESRWTRKEAFESFVSVFALLHEPRMLPLSFPHLKLPLCFSTPSFAESSLPSVRLSSVADVALLRTHLEAQLRSWMHPIQSWSVCRKRTILVSINQSNQRSGRTKSLEDTHRRAHRTFRMIP
jgi:hypothetical protein